MDGIQALSLMELPSHKWFMTQVTPESELASLEELLAKQNPRDFIHLFTHSISTLQASTGPHTLGIGADDANTMSLFNRVSFQV